MAQSYEFYNDRADEAAARAQEATLDNVRNRDLRAEKSWRDLADRARKGEQAREQAAAARRELTDAVEEAAAVS